MRRRPSQPNASQTGLSELHDISFGYQITALLRLLDGEPGVAEDLLRPRPWLAAAGPQQVLEAILDTEWAGFVARLGPGGPWVYAPTVAALQALSAAYTRRVTAGGDPAAAEAAFWSVAQTLAATQRDAWAARRGAAQNSRHD